MQTSEIRLAYLGFRLFSPGDVLRPYVKSYWYLSREAPLTTPQQEYLHPQGGFGIVFNFGDPISVDTQTVKAAVFLDGVNTVSRRLGFAGLVEQLGIRFHEGGAYPFLGIPLSEVRNEINLEGRVSDDSLLRLHARAYEENSLQKRINLLEEWLIERLSHSKGRSTLIPASIRLLRENAGRLPIAELAHELAISQRQLERLYQSEVGMPPKQYAGLLRVENARQALKKIKHCTMTRLGANLGYYDQSHFIREFRSVVGITPYAYWKRSRLHSRTGKV